MDVAEAARVLGVQVDDDWSQIRQAYRDRIRSHHPDRGSLDATLAVRIIEAYRVLRLAHEAPSAPPAEPSADPNVDTDPPTPTGATERPRDRRRGSDGKTAQADDSDPSVRRIDNETISIGAPADEAFALLLEAGHRIGDITYLDRSVPIFEALCRFEGEPATSLVVTIQGRADGTEAFCTAESIEARPGPPTEAVVDVFQSTLAELIG